MSRIVCWFSCGVASAVATKLAIAQYGKDNLVIARCIVREEHPDNDRFSDECQQWFGMPIIKLINEKFNGSMYEVIKKRGYISGVDGAPCTGRLKKDLRKAFQLPTDKHVFGYCAEEQGRWDDFLDANNIDAVSPLIERGLEHSDCLAMIQDAGIEIPVLYKLGYKHNNCIGCVKSTGQGYWNKIRDDFPAQFNWMAKESRRLNVRMIRIEKVRSFLDELEPGTGDYQSEPEIQCSVFCEMAKRDIQDATMQIENLKTNEQEKVL
jgi:hypothetical protein